MSEQRLLPDVDWQPLTDRLHAVSSVHLVTHRMPDSDGIGSQIALYYGLRQLGLSVTMYNADPVPRICQYLDGARMITCGDTPPEADLVIALDAGSVARLAFPSLVDSQRLVNIDHHASNNHYGSINIVDARYPATGAMIHDLLLSLGVSLTPSMAQSLYAAILTDTNAFRADTVTAGLHRLVASLIDAGADAALAAQYAYASHAPNRFILLKEALETLTLHDGERSALMYLDAEMFARSDCRVEDSEGFIEYARSIGSVDITVLLCQLRDNEWKVTFRGKRNCDVGSLAASLGGGGHRYAAGCTLKGCRSEVTMRIRQKVSTMLLEECCG